MKIKDLLPIGSSVLLKNGGKKLMIIGIMQPEGRCTGKRTAIIQVSIMFYVKKAFCVRMVL